MSVTKAFPYIEIAAEDALIVYFGDNLDDAIGSKIAALNQSIRHKLGPNLIDTIPSYVSLLVSYDPQQTDHFYVKQLIKACLDEVDTAAQFAAAVIEIPVWYSEQSGPDLQRIAQHNGLTGEQVIELHQQQEYQVYALGFAPGFAFLGEVDKRIAMPRLATPRTKVPKGAVAIADRQTAVYPAESPGGWNIIGLCPLDLFDSKQAPHVPFNVGDTVKFTSISEQEYYRLGGQCEF
ncbi:5-oxoprolinase subunit PxpB [Paraferrimonas sp. SM1919]|uniref:5-oxoprolinase subunit PxpB n=1 Tax=Paraferrimonas sp. SM1919 TaxID=2662263 RepID=UPI0013D6A2F6|nr:5-oxoprolinase subunit PxpB [Paraferrimonas sp. SM1919]